MAIGDKSQENTSMTTMSSAFDSAAAAQPVQAQKWSFHNAGAFNRAPIGRGIGSEALTAMKDALIEEFKQSSDAAELTTIVIDRTNEIKLDFSAIIVCMRNKNDLRAGVGYHTLMLEATGDEIGNHFENIGGKQIEVIHPTSDAADGTMNQIVTDKVRAAFPGQPVYFADYCVVPRNFDVKDKTAMHNLTVNASLAAATELSIHQKGFEDLNFAKFAKDSTLKAELTFGRDQIEDCVGLPMRSDFKVLLASKLNTQQGQPSQVSINSGDRVTKLSLLGGYIDLVYVPPMNAGMGNMYQPQGMANPYGMQQQQPQQTQLYIPRAIITNYESIFTSSYAAQLLSILTSFSLRSEDNWIQALKPIAMAGGKTDMHDIGGVGYEMNYDKNPNGFGSRVDTSANTFTMTNFGQLVASAINRDLVISMDIPEAGASTWAGAVYPFAANKDGGAIEAIIASANQLTNGFFRQKFPQGSTVFVSEPEKVHLGYYTDENGTKRDLRDIDYLAVLNLAGASNEPSYIKLWSDTYTMTGVPIQQRLADRKKVITALKPSAVFTGFANRVTFSQLFLDALVDSCNAVGVAMTVTTPMNTGDFNTERGTGAFLQGARLSNNIGGVFNRGYVGNNQQGNGAQFTGFSRW